LKAIANAIPCRINLGYTLSYKLQLQMVMRFLTNASLGESDLKLGLGKEIHPSLEFPGYLVTQIPNELKLDCFSYSWLEYKGVYYKKKVLLALETNLDQCVFGEVIFILIGKSKIPYFLVKRVYTVGFDSHFHAFEIKIDNSDLINYTELIGCYISELSNTTPTVARTIGNFKTYATLRYAS